MVYKRVRGWTSGRSLPVLKFGQSPPPPPGITMWFQYRVPLIPSSCTYFKIFLTSIFCAVNFNILQENININISIFTVVYTNCIAKNQHASQPRIPGLECTPLYELYRYVRSQRVGFFSRCGHKQGIELILDILGSTSIRFCTHLEVTTLSSLLI